MVKNLFSLVDRVLNITVLRLNDSEDQGKEQKQNPEKLHLKQFPH